MRCCLCHFLPDLTYCFASLHIKSGLYHFDFADFSIMMLRDFVKIQKKRHKAETITISIPADLASSVGTFHNSPKLGKLPSRISETYGMNSLSS